MPVCFLDIPYRQLSCLSLLSRCSTSHRSSSGATSALLSLSSPLPRVGALLLKFSEVQLEPRDTCPPHPAPEEIGGGLW